MAERFCSKELCLCYADPVIIDCSGKQLVHLPTFDKNVKKSAVSLFLDKNNFKELLISKEWMSLKEIYLHQNPFILCQSIDNMVKLGIKVFYDSCDNNLDLTTANRSNPHVFTGTENSTLSWTSKKWTTRITRQLTLPVTKKWTTRIRSTRRLNLPVTKKWTSEITKRLTLPVTKMATVLMTPGQVSRPTPKDSTRTGSPVSNAVLLITLFTIVSLILIIVLFICLYRKSNRNCRQNRQTEEISLSSVDLFDIQDVTMNQPAVEVIGPQDRPVQTLRRRSVTPEKSI